MTSWPWMTSPAASQRSADRLRSSRLVIEVLRQLPEVDLISVELAYVPVPLWHQLEASAHSACNAIIAEKKTNLAALGSGDADQLVHLTETFPETWVK